MPGGKAVQTLNTQAMNATASQDPIVHTIQLRQRMKDLIDHLRADVKNVDDPSAKALFEVSAEVLEGLHKAFEDYEQKNEPAWRVD
jgi:hypothetical protein